jgi:hypothetical protein
VPCDSTQSARCHLQTPLAKAKEDKKRTARGACLPLGSRLAASFPFCEHPPAYPARFRDAPTDSADGRQSIEAGYVTRADLGRLPIRNLSVRKLFIFVMGMLVGAGLVGFSFKYHVVYTNDGLILVPKKQAALGDLYVDVRNWKPSDWQAHPGLVQSLIARGRGDLIAAPGNEFLREMIRKFDNAEKLNDDREIE